MLISMLIALEIFLARNLDRLKLGVSYALYNDQPWRDDTSASILEPFLNSSVQITQKSLGKGIIAIDNSLELPGTGFHIIHSMPGFPAPISDTTVNGVVYNVKFPSVFPTSWFPVNDIMGYPRPSTLSDFGHVFFCQSFIDSQALLDVLTYAQPYIYRSNDQTRFKSLLNPPQSTPITKSADINTHTTIFTSTEQSIWQLNNIIPTANKKINTMVGTNVITETHLPYDFYSQFSNKLTRWRSSNEAGHIGYAKSNATINHRVCIGDIFNQEPGYLRSETMICVRNSKLRDFLYLSAYKQRDLNGIESVIGVQTLFSGPLQFFNQPNNLFQSTPSLLQYYQSLSDTLLRFTNFEIQTNNTELLDPTSKLQLIESDKDGMVTYNKNYQPTSLRLQLSSTTDRVQMLLNGTTTVYSLALKIYNDSLILDQPTDTDAKLVLLYNTIQSIHRITNPILINAGYSTPISVVIQYNNQTNTVQLGESPLIDINLNNICMESVFKSYSYFLITTLNTGIKNITSLQSNFQGLSQGENVGPQVFVRGLLNSLTLFYRQQIFKSLPDTLLQSIDQCNPLNSTNIEYYNNYQYLKTDNGYLSDGWVTSFFNDLIDNSVDSRDQIKTINDNYQLPTNKLFQTISQLTFDSNKNTIIFDFINLLNFNSNATTSISNIMKYDNIFQCNYCSTNPTQITNNTILEQYFLNKGVCQSDINLVGMNNLELYTLEWASNDTVIDYPTMWRTNRGLSTFYSDPNLFSKLQHPISPQSFIEITQLLIDLKESAPVVDSQNQYLYPLRYYYYPPSDQVSPSLVIVTLEDSLCAFDFVPPSQLETGEVYTICPTQPVISDITGLSGPTSQTNQITIIGQQLKNAIVQFGPNAQCIVNQPTNFNNITCTAPKGVGIMDLVLTNPTPIDQQPLLPIASNLDYQFVFDAPIIISHIDLDRKLGSYESQSLMTIIGKNFIGDTPNITLVDLVINNGQLVVKPTQLFTQNGQDYIVFKPTIGCGSANELEVVVGGQAQNNMHATNITFLPPTISQISVTTSPANGGGTMIISGTNFGTINNNVTAAFISNDIQFDDAVWLSDTQISVKIPVGYGKDQQITVQICDQFTDNNPNVKFSYDPPTLHEILYEPFPTNVLYTQFYVTGKNLATKEYVPDVYIFEDVNSTMECYSYASQHCKGKKYYDANGSPIPVPTQQPLDGPYDPFIDMNPSYRDSEEFDCFGCFISFGIGSKIGLIVAIGNQNVSTTTLNTTLPHTVLKYIAPSINSTVNNTSPTNGNGVLLTIKGLNFVPNENIQYLETEEQHNLDGGHAMSNVTIGELGSNCTDIIWVNSTEIICNVGYGIGRHNISVFVGGQQLSNIGEHLFTYHSPTMESFVPSTTFNTVGGTNITIKGINFVPNELLPPNSQSIDGGIQYSNVSIIRNFTAPDGTANQTRNSLCQSIEWINSTTITCISPYGIGKDYNISIFVGAQQLTNFGEFKFSFTAPLSSSLVSSISNSTRGGVNITISGEHFVPNEKVTDGSSLDGGQKVSNVSIGEFPSTKIEWTNSSTIICTLPPGVGKNLNLSVIVGEQQLSNHGQIKFSYSPPTLVEKRYLVPIGYSGEIQLTGTNFVPESLAAQFNSQQPQNNPNTTTISIGSIFCKSVRWINDTTANCTVPLGTGKNKFINVTIGEQSIPTNDYFSFLPPNITSITPAQGRSGEETTITINGDNFGIPPNEGGKDLPQPIVLANQTESYIRNVTLVSTKRIICIIKPNIIGTYTIVVRLDGQESNSSNWKTYGPPKINSINPKGGNVNGGYAITIAGENLIEEGKNPPKVVMNNVEIAVNQSSLTQIIFQATKGGGRDIPIYVSLNGNNSNTNTDFAYDPPSIFSVVPPSLKSENTQRVNIQLNGQDLGLNGMQLDQDVTIGSGTCINTQIYSSSRVNCDAPTGLVGPQKVTLKFKGQSATNTIIYTKQQDEPTQPGTPIVSGPPVAIPPPILPPVVLPPIPPIVPIVIIPDPNSPHNVIVQYTNDVSLIYNVGPNFGFNRLTTTRIQFNATINVKKESNNNPGVSVANPRDIKTYKTTMSLTATALVITTSYISLVADVTYRGVLYSSVLFQGNPFTNSLALPKPISGTIFIDNTFDLIYNPATTDQPAYNVRISITDSVVNQVYTISTPTTGAYSFNMAPGNYKITFPDLNPTTQNLLISVGGIQKTVMANIGQIFINNNAAAVTYNFPLDPRVTDCRSYVLSGQSRLNYQYGRTTISPLQFCYSPTVCTYPISFTNNVAGSLCTTTVPSQTIVDLLFSNTVTVSVYTDNSITGVPTTVIPTGVTFTVYSTNLAKQFGPFTPAASTGSIAVSVPAGPNTITLASTTFTSILNNYQFTLAIGASAQFKFGMVQNSVYNNQFVRFFDQPNFTGQTLTLPGGLYQKPLLDTFAWTTKIKSFQAPPLYYVYLYSQDNSNSLIPLATTGNVVVNAPVVARIEISYGNINLNIGPDGSMFTLPYPSSYMANLVLKYPLTSYKTVELNCNSQTSQCFMPSGFGGGTLSLYYKGQLLSQKYSVTFLKLYNIPAPNGYNYYLNLLDPSRTILGQGSRLSITIGTYKSELILESTGLSLQVTVGAAAPTVLLSVPNTQLGGATVPYQLVFQADTSLCIKGTQKCVGPAFRMGLQAQFFQLVQNGAVMQNSKGEVIWSLLTDIPRATDKIINPIHPLSRSVPCLDALGVYGPASLQQGAYLTNGVEYLTVTASGQISISRMPLPASNFPSPVYTTYLPLTSSIAPFKLTMKADSNFCIQNANGADAWCSSTQQLGGRFFSVVPSDQLSNNWGYHVFTLDGRMIFGDFDQRLSTNTIQAIKPILGTFVAPSDYFFQYKPYGLQHGEFISNGRSYLQMNAQGIVNLYSVNPFLATTTVYWSSTNAPPFAGPFTLQVIQGTLTVCGPNPATQRHAIILPIQTMAASSYLHFIIPGSEISLDWAFLIQRTADHKVIGGQLGAPTGLNNYVPRQPASSSIQNSYLQGTNKSTQTLTILENVKSILSGRILINTIQFPAAPNMKFILIQGFPELVTITDNRITNCAYIYPTNVL
eukprot:gene7625-9381_t